MLSVNKIVYKPEPVTSILPGMSQDFSKLMWELVQEKPMKSSGRLSVDIFFFYCEHQNEEKLFTLFVLKTAERL